MSGALSIRAGTRAINIIRDEGLDLSRVKVIAGASGSAKFLVLTWIDRVLMSLLKDCTHPIDLIGTSIGAFRMAAFCEKDPVTAIDILERKYIEQHFSRHPAREEITQEGVNILDAYIDDNQINEILSHPFFRINFLANRSKGLMKSETMPLLMAGLGVAAAMNLVHRRLLRFSLERALFCRSREYTPFAGMDEFPMTIHQLTAANFKKALLASGSVPVIMEGICDIPGIPGMFRDGGIIDYHLDLPFLPDNDGLVLYPHFYDYITPGWFDKNRYRKPNPEHMKNVVLISPSKAFVKTLPHGRIPDRKDFQTFKGRDKERMDFWWTAAEKSKQLGEDFHDAVVSGKIRHLVKPL